MPRPAVVRAIISNVLMTYFSATNDIECLWDLEGCMDSSLLARSCTVHGKVREHTRDCHLVFVPNSERQYQKEVLFPQSSLESFPI